MLQPGGGARGHAKAMLRVTFENLTPPTPRCSIMLPWAMTSPPCVTFFCYAENFPGVSARACVRVRECAHVCVCVRMRVYVCVRTFGSMCERVCVRTYK